MELLLDHLFWYKEESWVGHIDWMIDRNSIIIVATMWYIYLLTNDVIHRHYDFEESTSKISDNSNKMETAITNV